MVKHLLEDAFLIIVWVSAIAIEDLSSCRLVGKMELGAFAIYHAIASVSDVVGADADMNISLFGLVVSCFLIHGVVSFHGKECSLLNFSGKK